ncbi:hypothetical protein Mapa_000186 [Marchantia paleacea]|nr:hypothetical protein Mapa_000186 [Marchantia paleacea]
MTSPPVQCTKEPNGQALKKQISVREDQAPTKEDGATMLDSAPDGSSGDEPKKWQSSDWEWPAYDEYYNRQGDVVERCRRKSIGEEEEKEPFEVIYCVIKQVPWPELVLVEVHSPHLRKVLHNCWPSKQKLLVNQTYSFKGKDLFLKLDELKGLLDPQLAEAKSDRPASDESIKQVQLRHLIRFLEIEYSTCVKEHERLKTEGRVSFDMLWTFIVPGVNVVFKSPYTEDDVCGKVRKAVYRMNNDTPSKMCLCVKLEVYNYNCDTFHSETTWSEVAVYNSERPFGDLNIYPFGSTAESAQSMEERFLAQGASYGYLTTAVRYRYMQFKGHMFEEKRNNYGLFRVSKENADGKVMVDLFSFCKLEGEGTLSSPLLPSTVTRDGIIGTVDISQDPNRMYAPGFVYGFSFRLKRWGSFSIHGFSEIVFDDGSSWNQLVMNPVLKEVTEHLVSEHLKKSVEDSDSSTHQGIDPIANKGEGCVIICYGPPGTGKTLTAESLAEKLRAPLWSLSVSELGLTPDCLEDKLVSILEVANSWHTILLLDEADVYLEKRTISSDLTRNAMTGLFLRHLEYYKGVLLLTTNRILTFDDAFRSRISVFLRYPKLTTDQRQIIWTNLLRRAHLEGEESVVQQLVQDMAALELNGREIRNAIQNAQTLARHVKEPLGCKHVMNATEVLASSLATLQDD